MNNINLFISFSSFRKLAAFASLFALVMLISITGKAQVIYTEDSGTVYNPPTTLFAPIDLDDDGTYDYYFGAYRKDTVISGVTNYASAGLVAANPGAAIAGDRYPNGNLPRIFKLNLGDTIGPNLHFNTDSAPLPQYLVSIDSLYDTANASPIQAFIGYYRDTNYHYMGVKFNDGTNTYYGWVRVKMKVLGAKLVGVNYFNFAYESTPNTPIIAGDTGGVFVAVKADTAYNIIATDVADNGNGLDLNVTFNKAANENTVASYRVIVVPDTLASVFDVTAAQAVPSAWYSIKIKTGSNINTTLQAASRDFQGNLIANGIPYRVFVLNIADGTNANINTLSTPSNVVTLATVANPISADSATAIAASDVTNNVNATDLQVGFNKAAQENTVGTYRIIVVKASASPLTLSLANGIAVGNYTIVTPNGANVSQTLAAGAKDADGDAIAQNVAYKVYVLNIADGTNANVNSLSGPSNTVTLTHPVGISNITALENVEVFSNNNVVNIHFMDANNSTGILTIFNANGQQVYANHISGDQHISLNGAAGVYLLNLIQDGKVMSKQLFISNK